MAIFPSASVSLLNSTNNARGKNEANPGLEPVLLKNKDFSCGIFPTEVRLFDVQYSKVFVAEKRQTSISRPPGLRIRLDGAGRSPQPLVQTAGAGKNDPVEQPPISSSRRRHSWP